MTDSIEIPIEYKMPRHFVRITPDLARQIVAMAKPTWHQPSCITNPGDMQPSHAATDLDPAKWAKASAAAGAKPVPVDAAPTCKDSLHVATAADDEAAVEAMRWIKTGGNIYVADSTGEYIVGEKVARIILAAIKAGKVPGVCCDNDPNALSRRIAQECADLLGKLNQSRAEVERLKADLAAMTERAEKAERGFRNISDGSAVGDIIANWTKAEAERDAARAEAAQWKERAEKAERERDEARATRDLHKERQQDEIDQANAARAENAKLRELLREVEPALNTRHSHQSDECYSARDNTGHCHACGVLTRIDAALAEGEAK